MKKLILLFLLSLALGITAFMIWPGLYHYILSQMTFGEITFYRLGITGQFRENLIFAMSIMLFPWIIFLLEKLANLDKPGHKVLTVFIVLLAGFSLPQIYLVMTFSKMKKRSAFSPDMATGFEAPNPSIYILIGFILGAALCWLLFRKREAASDLT